VLVKYTTSSSDAKLALDPVVFRQMREHVLEAEEQGSDEARVKAYRALKSMIDWLSIDPA
jgi:hypothetical protein